MAEKENEPNDLKSRFTTDLKEARNYMDPIQQRMDKDYMDYRNRPNADDTSFKVSDLFEYTETVVPIVTNNRVRANVRSDYPEYVVQAKGLNDILDHTYDVNDWDYKSQQIVRLALIYRSCFAYTGYDKQYRNGTGKLSMDVINPRWVLVDPAAPELEDSRFFFYVEPMRKTKMKAMYPNKASDIDRAVGSDNMNFNGNNNSGWFKTWITKVKNFLVFNQTATQAKQAYDPFTTSEIDEQEKHKNVVAYIHYWYRDDQDEWRCSYWADDCFLKDEANPFWHGGLPYDIFSPVKDPLSMLGVPINDQIESMNINRNDMMNYVIENSRKQANPPLLWNTTFGNVKDPQKLNEEATGTGIIPINNPDLVPLNTLAEYMNVNAMSANAVGLFDQLGAIKDSVTGVNDSFRGTQQASSGKEVQLQQEAAYTRIKTMVDQLELFNKKIAQKNIINSMQYYTTERGFRIKGDYRKYEADQKMNEEMPFEVEKIQKGIDPATEEPQYDRTEFFLYANPNEWTKLDPEGEVENDDSEEATEQEVKKAFKVLQMTVEIEAGSSLPQSRLARREEAAELFGAGAIDQESLLDTYDWPDREEIMKRMQEKEQAQQEAQAQTAQAEAQASMQMEQNKLQQQMQLEEMKIQADVQKQQMSDQAKIQQQSVSNKGEIAEQGVENSDSGLAEVLDQLRQSIPGAENLSDEEMIAALSQ